MLTYYDLVDHRHLIRKWYNGYLFGSIQVYNPWSVTNYVKTLTAAPDEPPAPYWANTKYASWLPAEGYTGIWNYGVVFFRK